ncbi:MAG: MFS transporter, partial [Actinomycetales bacterium]
WADLNVPWVRRIFIAGIGLAIAQQCTGINSVMYYGSQLLVVAGFAQNAAMIANIVPGIISVVGSMICLFVLIDRVPRRTLIIGGIIATTICHGLIVLASVLMPDGMAKAYTILALVVAFVFCMQTALNVPVWVCLSELFPLRMRGFGMGFCVLMLWIANAVIAFSFPILVDVSGITGSFLFFFVVGIFWVFFLYKLLPNTSGRSLEELEEAFAAGDFH